MLSRYYVVLLFPFLFGISCKNKNSRIIGKKSKDNPYINSSCLKNFIKFSDSLDLHKVAHLEDVLEGNNNFLDQCEFKCYRNNPDYKIAVVQLGLKFDLYFLERGRHDVDMSFMFYASRRCKKIINEIAFYAYQKEIDYPEFMGTTLVYWIIANNPSIKDDPRIQPLFAKCMKLEDKKILAKEFKPKKRKTYEVSKTS